MSARHDVPDLVARALRFSLERGYLQATRSETGRLLATLAATRSGTIAECGTGCGVGAAWLRTGAPDRTRVITAELDGELAHLVMDLFADRDIDVIHADWTSLAEHGPFSLLLIDADTAAESPREAVIDLLESGAVVVLDDVPVASRVASVTDGRIDAMRQEWLSDDRFIATEVLVAEDAAVVIAAKR